MGAKFKPKTYLLNKFFRFLALFFLGFKVWKKYKFGLKKFHTDFKSAEKVFKSVPKKIYKQNKFEEHE